MFIFVFTDNQLIDMAREGDPKAFCDLYDQSRESMYRYAFYKLGSREDAEDAVQDCVLDAWRQIRNLRSSEAFKTWIFRILSGCCNRKIKSLIREREKIEAAAQTQMTESANDTPVKPGTKRPDGAEEHDQISTLTESLDLSKALQTLSDQERDVVLLSVVGGFTSAEVGHMTGLTAGGVRSKLSRSLKKMRGCLEERSVQ